MSTTHSNSLTPRQHAYSIAIDWVRNAYHGNTGDLDELTPAVQKQVKEHLEKIHHLLVNKSRMDETPLRTSLSI